MTKNIQNLTNGNIVYVNNDRCTFRGFENGKVYFYDSEGESRWCYPDQVFVPDRAIHVSNHLNEI